MIKKSTTTPLLSKNSATYKRSFYFLCTFVVLIFWSSCRKDFDFAPSTGNLEFSKDTVYLDTIFSNIGSSTYNLKVYNRSNSDIVIPTVRLSEGQASKYRLNVDGMAGKEFQNIEILAKDSMYIFVETTFDIQSEVLAADQFLYTDAIEFDSGTKLQKVELVTLVKDAVFIYPNRDAEGIIETLSFDVDGDGTPDQTAIQGRFLEDSELIFTNQKPYVIYGYAAVNANKTLTVEAGARIHFHANSGLLITNNATLKVNGQLSNDQELLENEVIFQGDRLEPLFKDIPGQWGTIWLFSGSKNNVINYATIKNGTVGLLVENDPNMTNAKLNIKNSKLFNHGNFGILGRATSINAENTVFNNFGQSAFAGTFGGTYNFTHCTIGNYWNNSFRQFPTLVLTNYMVDENETVFTNPLVEANFNNCIVFGNASRELLLDKAEGSDFNFKFTNSLIRYQNLSGGQNSAPYDFTDTTFYENVILNQNPDFKDGSKNQMNIGSASSAINQGASNYANQVPNDILNVNRTTSPDLGAYQHITFED